MNDFVEIEKAVGSMGLDDNDDESNYEGASNLTSTDMIPILQHRIEMLTSENIALHRRMTEMEGKVEAMYAHFVKSPERSRIEFRSENHIRDKYVTETNSLDANSGVRVDANPIASIEGRGSTASPISRRMASPTPPSARQDERVRERSTPARTPSTTPTRSEPINPFMSYIQNINSNDSMFKSNSATAPQGYIKKGDVWGTALVSFLTAAMRYYIAKKEATMLMVDEKKMFSVYSKIVPVLYESFMSKQLPAVSDALTFRLSQAIARKNKDDIPISDAESWLNLEETQEGKDIMSIIRILLMAAKAVPEAMIHPVSQLIPFIHSQPVVRRGSIPVFAIHADVNVNPIPGAWESWCLVLKNEALMKYVRYRLSNMTAGDTVTRMTNEMKREELSEKKNWRKLMSFNPAAMISQSEPNA